MTNTRTYKVAGTEELKAQQLASSQLLLKRADKEIQTFTYWNDSSAYQYQLTKENSQESSSAQLKKEDKQLTDENQ